MSRRGGLVAVFDEELLADELKASFHDLVNRAVVENAEEDFDFVGEAEKSGRLGGWGLGSDGEFAGGELFAVAQAGEDDMLDGILGVAVAGGGVVFKKICGEEVVEGAGGDCAFVARDFAGGVGF